MTASIISSVGGKIVIQFEFNLGSSMLESEKSLQASLNKAGILGSSVAIEQFDTTGQPLVYGNTSMTSKGKVSCTYQTPYGEISVSRHVYQSNQGGKTFCPLEQNARILLSATPFFAKQLSHKYAEHGAFRVTEDLDKNHGREIARSFVQNIAEAVASVAQSREENWQYETPKIEENVTTVSIGIDGACMLTVTDGWRQAMVGSIALYSSEKIRLHTIYIGATPEYGKETFIERMEREIANVKSLYPKGS